MITLNKLYKINGGDNGNDYGASSFEQKYKGMKVGDICEQLLGDNDSYEDDDDGFGIYREDPIQDFEQSIFFRMRDYMDYDDLKHEKLYLDFEVIN